ncbi:MAG: NAD(P)H-dependent glycerol-3-phosphate dehydrogenase [Gammaproteobacteria bacterium]
MPAGAAAIMVAGAGSWGTALAIMLARAGAPTLLWGRDPAHMATLAAERRNGRYLPGVSFPPALELSHDLDAGLARSSTVVVATPLGGVAALLERVARRSRPLPRLVWACKGIEPGTLRLVHEIAEAVLGPGVEHGVLSGPTFAAEVVAGQPTAAVIATASTALAQDMVSRLHGGSLRIYSNPDVVGVELAGAVKNVLAIGAGIADGLGFGANTRAALVTRGLAEMVRMGVALGARPATFTGLAGLGDLVLTCTDDKSRNRRLGIALGRGMDLAQALAGIGQAVEGVPTAAALRALAARHAVQMPISDAVAQVLDGKCRPDDAVRTLLARDPAPESI